MESGHAHHLALDNLARTEVELTESPQCNAQPASPSTSSDIIDTNDDTISHSANLSFPTLNQDGSLPDLTALPTRRYSTPPAALSSLGAKARMADLGDMSDSQYDMLDDASDISNDDQDTASRPSTEHHDSDVGELTPDEDGSVVDFQEQHEQETEPRDLKNDTILEAILDEQTAAENEVMDSYLSEDLETPRQSTLPADLGGRSHRRSGTESTATGPAPAAAHDVDDISLSILFVSEPSVPDGIIADICSHVVTSISSDLAGCSRQVVRLPPTPSGISPSSALLLRTDEIEVTIQHCIGAEARGSKSYNLRIQDADKENSSIFTIGQSGKIDLDKPDLVIFYLSEEGKYSAWFDTVKHALPYPEFPSMTIGAPSFTFGSLEIVALAKANHSDIVLEHQDFFSEDDSDLRADLEVVLRHKLTPDLALQTIRAHETTHAKKTAKNVVLQSMKKHVSVLLLLGILLQVISYFFQPVVNPVAELAVRREALSTALTKMTNSTDSARFYNVEHLVPRVVNSSATVHFQGANPNHVVVSLPKKSGSKRFPQVMSTKVYKSGGRDIDFKTTQLIPGIYDVSVATKEAYGLITVNLLAKHPSMNVTVAYDFGRKLWQMQKYNAASAELSKELSKMANKEVAVASEKAKSLSDKFGFELSASAAATRNVTSQLTVYAARELQVWSNTALSVAGKAAVKSKVAAEALKVDFKHSLGELASDFQKLGKLTADSAKALVPSQKTTCKSFALSRQRALGFKDLLAGRKKDTNSTSATKELSLRLQNIFSPSEKTKKAGSLANIARCVRAEDYKACRKAQKNKALSTYKAPKDVATVLKQDAVKEFPNMKPPRTESKQALQNLNKAAKFRESMSENSKLDAKGVNRHSDKAPKGCKKAKKTSK